MDRKNSGAIAIVAMKTQNSAAIIPAIQAVRVGEVACAAIGPKVTAHDSAAAAMLH